MSCQQKEDKITEISEKTRQWQDGMPGRPCWTHVKEGLMESFGNGRFELYPSRNLGQNMTPKSKSTKIKLIQDDFKLQ